MTSEAGGGEPPRPHRPRSRTTLAQLARHLGAPAPTRGEDGTEPPDPLLTGVVLDSRQVRPGDLYCALPGARTHGGRFAASARESGAVAALTDAAGAPLCADAGLPALVVADPRADAARAAALVHGEPARELATVAVTGTNGKTSVTTMLHHTLLARGRASGVIGTSGTRYRDAGGRDHGIGTVRTTPEATDLHGILARMVEDEVTSCAMEVSSHALVLHRVDGVVYDVACFTGLSQDHLDFHHTMEEYYRAKASLFTPERARRAVICVDEEWGRRLARETPLPHLTYASRPGTPADVSVLEARPEGFGTRIRIRRENADEQELYSPLPGEHYVANAIAVMLLLEAIGQEGPEVREAIGRAGTVPGRMERVAEHPVRGIVDFSHTEDALDGALRTLRAAAPGSASRLLIVLGAGGDRDRGKRPHMGAVAGRLADVVIITDDNPRSEDPAVIREQVAAGIPPDSAAEVHVVAGRAEAITLACALAHVSDTILVAGKGAERGQDIGGTVLPFDDRVQLDRALRARFGTTGPDGAPVTEGRS